MDLQFVLDVYASVMDFVSCISKAQKGITKILQAACDEARKGNAIINPSHPIMSLTTLHTVLYTFVKVLKIIFVTIKHFFGDHYPNTVTMVFDS